VNKSRNRIKQKKIEKNVDLVNEDIKFENILLVSENGNQMINTKDALSTAREKNLDLFCVSAKTEPPVCKILDYKKYIFDLNKNKKIKKDNSPKEIRISPNIGDNDLKVKLGRIGK
jgi:translation initiation factor IF-3